MVEEIPKTLTFYDEAALLQHPQQPSYYMDFEGDAIGFTEQFAVGIEAGIVYYYAALDQRPKTIYPEKTDFSKAKLLRLGNG